MIRLRWLPVNQAWVFLFGADIATATIIDMDGTRFFSSRQEAIAAAHRKGLGIVLNTDGVVTSL